MREEPDALREEYKQAISGIKKLKFDLKSAELKVFFGAMQMKVDLQRLVPCSTLDLLFRYFVILPTYAFHSCLDALLRLDVFNLLAFPSFVVFGVILLYTV